MFDKPKMEDILVDLFESQQQAAEDLCGEQRAWHLPRLNRVARAMIRWFPADEGAALLRVKSPGDEGA